jgi:hypothetical protein
MEHETEWLPLPKPHATPYPTERMVMFDQYEAGYSAGYSAGRRKILNKIDTLIKNYTNPVDLVCEITYMLCEEREKQ